MEELLRIDDLSVEYRTGGATAKALNHLSLTVHKGEALGLVGESGAGKTTTALSILNLLPPDVGFVTSGTITYNGTNLLKMPEREMNKLRGDQIAMVFQNPLSSLNPVFSIQEQLEMVLNEHKKLTKKEAHDEAVRLLEMVGIPGYRLEEYPHQFSGGMRQRVGISAALACDPDLLICDEPTTALDVTIQAQILEIMKKLQAERDMAMIMITHNLGIIAELCQTVAIMYSGAVIEYGTVEEVFTHPKHWYTIGLLNAIPKLTGEKERLNSIPGNVVNAENLPDGCRFHPRCVHCTEKCEHEDPPLMDIGNGHMVACWNRRED